MSHDVNVTSDSWLFYKPKLTYSTINYKIEKLCLKKTPVKSDRREYKLSLPIPNLRDGTAPTTGLYVSTKHISL